MERKPKTRTQEIEESDTVANLKRRLQRTGSESTAKTYINRLKIFFDWLGREPDEFLSEVEAETADIVRILNNFLDELHAQKKSPSTQAGHISAIKKLVTVNIDTTVNWARVELPKLRRVEEDAVPTKEIISEVLVYSDPKERAIALVAASSGLRLGTMAALSMEDLDLESEPDIGVIRIPANKSKGGIKFATFVTPEARKSLEAYLAMRKDLGPKDPVFARRTGGYYLRSDKLAKRWLVPLGKAGLDQRSGKWRIYRFHTLRKFFRTALEYGGVSKSFRERLLGHQGEYLDDAYFGPEFEKLVTEYRKGIPHLTIEETGVSEERVAGLEEELVETKERLEEAMNAFETMKDATIGRMMRQVEAAGVDTSRTPHELAVEMGLVEAQPAQKVIDEEELVAHLNDGWRFVSALNNGSTKVVVEK